MKKTNRSIFRSDAVQRYTEAREKAVLPRFVRPRVFLFLWLLVGLLVASGVVAWFAKIPVYASGTGVVQWDKQSEDEIVLVAFLPPDTLAQLDVGQTVFVQIDAAGERLSRSVIAVEPEVVSPDVAQKQFGGSNSTLSAITQPSAVATIQLGSIPGRLPSEAYIGSAYSVEVEIGSRRLLSLMPFTGEVVHE